jgi:hypothetical protein
MSLITNEVYDYMLDDIQRSTMRSISKMNDIVAHLKLQSGAVVTVEKYASKAAEVQNLLKQAATMIDELPALGIDLEELINEPEKHAAVTRLSNEEAVRLVGPAMSAAGMERKLLQHYGAISVQFDMVKNDFIIMRNEESQ